MKTSTAKHRANLRLIASITGAITILLVMISSWAQAAWPLRVLASLGPPRVALLMQFFFSLLLLLVAELCRAAGYRAGLRSFGTILGASAIVPFLIFSSAPSASPLWWFAAPAMLLFYLWPFVDGLRPHTVRLELIELNKKGDARSDSDLIRVAHLSDLHLCETLTMEGGLSADRVERAAKEALRWALDKAEFVFLTGDLTDRGSQAEWHRLAEILAGLAPDERARIFFVPGNHDLSISGDYENENDGNMWHAHEEQHRHFATSVLRSFSAGWRIGAGKADLDQIFSQAGDYIEQYNKRPPTVASPLESLKSLKTRLESLNGILLPFSVRGRADVLADDSVKRFAEMVPPMLLGSALAGAASAQAGDSFWPSPRQPLFLDLVGKLYPMVFHEDERCTIIGLNSNTAMANSVLSGAFGLLGKDQLDDLDTLMRASGDRCKIVMLHHHVGRPATRTLTEGLDLLESKTLQLRDAAALHKVLSQHSRVIVFHGHVHIGYHASKGEVAVVSGPSIAYGDRKKKTKGPNCFVYQVDAKASQPRDLVRVLDSTTLTATLA